LAAADKAAPVTLPNEASPVQECDARMLHHGFRRRAHTASFLQKNDHFFTYRFSMEQEVSAICDVPAW